MASIGDKLEFGRRSAEELGACVLKADAPRAAWVIRLGEFNYSVVVEVERAGKAVPGAPLAEVASESQAAEGGRHARNLAWHLHTMGAATTFWDFPGLDDDITYVYVEAVSPGKVVLERAEQARGLRFSADGNFKPYLGDD